MLTHNAIFLGTLAKSRILCLMLIAGLTCQSLSLAAKDLSTYAITDIGTLGGVLSEANGINNRGEVVGSSSTVTSTHAFLYSSGQLRDLGTLGGSSQATGISDRGQIVGFFLVNPRPGFGPR
jgi:probable HAF family extracellular repeat protein